MTKPCAFAFEIDQSIAEAVDTLRAAHAASGGGTAVHLALSPARAARLRVVGRLASA